MRRKKIVIRRKKRSSLVRRSHDKGSKKLAYEKTKELSEERM